MTREPLESLSCDGLYLSHTLHEVGRSYWSLICYRPLPDLLIRASPYGSQHPNTRYLPKNIVMIPSLNSLHTLHWIALDT